jgi:3-deoxy-D-manno-octulosonate 8-phosphate phosphatase (KDO 8-P phosphatase)
MQILTSIEDITARAREIRALVLDVDGVLTGGELLYTSSGEEIKQFNILDGLGIKLLQRNNVEVAIISGRQSPMLKRRATELGISQLVQGREDKHEALQELCASTGLSLDHIAYAGDDLPDLRAIRAVRLGLTVPNGHPLLRQYAQGCTDRSGGNGAVRELADFILNAQNRYDDAIASFL